MDQSDPPDRSFLLTPGTWYTGALIVAGVGGFMYALEADGVKGMRLSEPVRTMGEFVKAECVVTRGRNRSYYLRTTYAFTVPGYVMPQWNPAVPPGPPNFTNIGDVEFDSPSACEEALPAALAARAPHPIWFEKSNPHAARTTLEEPDSRRFLLVSLAALPLALIGWLVGRPRRRLAQDAG
ncbi:MAG: hypothetical protein EOO54_05780 [Haliea sp.]|nr:MAG: hypothetical protein EOO54_05780 [Haliea sp.]